MPCHPRASAIRRCVRVEAPKVVLIWLIVTSDLLGSDEVLLSLLMIPHHVIDSAKVIPELGHQGARMDETSQARVKGMSKCKFVLRKEKL